MIETEELMRLAGRDASQADATGSLTADVVAAIRYSGILRHFVPAHWGGSQGTFSEYFKTIAALGEVDTSSAWCAALMAQASRMAAFLPQSGQQAVWGDSPDAFLCATIHPNGLATMTSDGWLVEGSWSYVSGVRFADWALLCCRVPDGHPRIMLVPRQAFTVEETWDAAGMRATGSETLKLASTLVSTSHSFTIESLFFGDRSSPSSCFAAPHQAVSGITFVAPLVGAARKALSIWQEQLRVDATGSRVESIAAQISLASASAKTDAAEMLVERAARAAEAHPHAPVSIGRNRRDYAMAASMVSQAVTEVFQTAGVRASSHGGHLQRIWRDVGAAALHPALRLDSAAVDYFASVIMH